MGKIYLLYGPEKYDLNLKVEKIKKEFEKLELGVNLFYITKENIEELESCLQSVTFWGTSKLIIIKDTKLKFPIDLLKEISDDVVVVILEDSVDKRTSDYKAISKIAQCIEFKQLDSKELIQYIIQVLGKYGIQISYLDAEYFQSLCGESKENLVNELKKLVIYLDGETKVNKEIIEQVCSKTLNAEIFDVLSKIIHKKKKEGILLLESLLKQKESIIKIYIMLYKQIKQMYMIKYLNNAKVKDISSVIKIHPYVLKNLSQASEHYTLQELKNILYQFDEYDQKTKLGEMDFEIGLKKLIASM